MPKVKTRRGAAKRFSFTGTGKVKRKRAYLRHILTSKSAKQKRQLRQGALVAASDVKQIRRMLPNG
ncbi:MAG: large subunit ribosomal protein L35 [Hyphomicrobiaceae bacterium]|jgi:large subunit ribosomal protein L35